MLLHLTSCASILLLHAHAALLGKPGLDSTAAWLQVVGRV